MKYTWDPQKNAANIAKHGFDFRDAVSIFELPVLVRADRRRDYGEDRYAAIGSLEGIILTVIYTDREGERRIISVRQSNRKERRAYVDAFGIEDGLGTPAPDDRRGD